MTHDILFFMDSQWLKDQFKRNPDSTKADLARALGLEPPAISKILSGTRQIKIQEYMAMRQFFGLPVEGDEAAMPNRNSVIIEPLETAAGFREDQAKPGAWTMPASILTQRTAAPSEQIKIFQVNENVMEPDYKKGEHVVVDLSDTNPSPPGVYIVSDGFGFMIRHCAYVPKSAPPEIKLTANQKSFQAQTLKAEEFAIIGRVIAKLQWV